MNIEEIRSEDELGGPELLAIVIRYGEGYPVGLHYLTDPEWEIQAAVMRRPKGETIGPFEYRTVTRRQEQSPTQMVLILKSGKVLVEFYDTLRNARTIRLLEPGDVLVCLVGGYRFEMVEESEIVEIKHGPYVGREREKNSFEPWDGGDV